MNDKYYLQLQIVSYFADQGQNEKLWRKIFLSAMRKSSLVSSTLYWNTS